MDTPNTILIIDPHPARARFLKQTLGDSYRYDVAYDLASGMTRIEESEPDLILVAEDTSGVPLESWLRQVAFVYSVPTIVIAGCEWPVERTVRFLEAGAAYNVDRTEALYLCAVVRRTLQRVSQARQEWECPRHGQQDLGCVTIDHDLRVVRVNGRKIKLTPREWDIFAPIADGRGAPVHPDDIVYRVWGERPNGCENHARRVVLVYIRYLRHKLGRDRILTEPNIGYRLVMEAS